MKKLRWGKVPKGYTDYKQKRGKYCIAWRKGCGDVVRIKGFCFKNKDPHDPLGRVAYKVINGQDKGKSFTAKYDPKDLTLIRWFDNYQSAAAFQRTLN